MLQSEELLQLLRTSERFLSGEKLSRKLGVTRAAIWKKIEQLRAEGYEIESVTRKGYRLRKTPDILTETEIRAHLAPGTFGASLTALQTVDSTNNEARRLAEKGAPHGCVVVSEEQTGGKGRLGRQWVSPPGSGIWFSVLLRPHALPEEVTGVTLLSAVAVCRAIRKETGLDAKIKWPNDVVIGTKKVCGILTELSAEWERVHYLIVGIGVNVNQAAFPPELSERATSLSLETDRPVERAVLLCAILEEFERLYDQYGVSSFPEEYRANCITVGRAVSLTRAGKTIKGFASGVRDDGALLIQTENEGTIAATSGEVVVQGIYGQTI